MIITVIGVIKKCLKNIGAVLIRDVMNDLDMIGNKSTQKGTDYLIWLNSQLLDLVNEFVSEQKLLSSVFIRDMNKSFKTTRFNNLLQRRLAEYLFALFNILDAYSSSEVLDKNKITLEDNPLNRFAATKYCQKFNAHLAIKWIPAQNIPLRLLQIISQNMAILIKCFKNGLTITKKKEHYKVMREAAIGLYDIGGYYGQDDYFIDGDIIKKHDCIFFSRGVPGREDPLRQNAYYDFQKSEYAFVDIYKLPLGVKTFIKRIVPNYIVRGSMAMLREIRNPMFSWFAGLFSYFINWAIVYERFFSSYKITSEFGHSYYSSRHIIDAIVCQNYGTKYYLTHWSDNSVKCDSYLLSFLGCDKFLLWGKAHIYGVEGNTSILLPIGYLFKRFINQIRKDRTKALKDMGIEAKGKIISFFDESFGGGVLMTEDHYVGFWETALKTAIREKDHTIVIKPKELNRHKNLSCCSMKRFIRIKDQIEALPNAYVVNEIKWCFIEAIGIADIVVTQSMTSSATIAIICGIEGLYLDQSAIDHPFSKKFKDKLVFDDPEKLISMIHEIVIENESPLKYLPGEVVRGFDAYADDRSMDIFRKILAGDEYCDKL